MTLLAVATSGRGLVDPDTPVLHADNGALLRGRGAFETLRVYNNTPFRYDAHLERLTESAARIGLPPVDRADIDKLASDAIAASGHADAVLRLYWTPGRESNQQPQALVLVSSLPAGLDETSLARHQAHLAHTRIRHRSALDLTLVACRSEEHELRGQHGRRG